MSRSVPGRCAAQAAKGGPPAFFPIGARNVSRMLVSSPAGAPLSERRLLAAARRGDQHAMCLLLRHYQPVAHAIARYVRVPYGVDREEIAQAALLGVANAIKSWRPGLATFRSYVRTCARNAAVNAVNAACAARNLPLTRAASLDALAETGHELACGAHGGLATTDPLDIVIAREQIRAMAAALPTLTAMEAFCLRGDLNGRSHAELAAAIGATTKAVGTAIARARRKLKRAAEHSAATRLLP
jgi:RNA polymerase sigma factor (sigma-70 family)